MAIARPVARPGAGATGSAAGSAALAGRLVVASALAVVAAAACYGVFVLTRTGQHLDDHFGGGTASVPGVGAPAKADLSLITVWSLAAVLVAVVAVGFLRRRPALGVVAAGTAGAAVVVVDGLKSRILVHPDVGYGGFNTFPSGHTAVAAACALAIVVVSPPRGRGVVAVVGGAYACLTALQVQSAGWHRPSDTVGAALLAFAATSAGAALVAWRRPVTVVSGGSVLSGATVRSGGTVAGAARAVLPVGPTLVVVAGTVWGLVLAGVDHDAPLAGSTLSLDVVALLVAVLVRLLGSVDLDAPAAVP